METTIISNNEILDYISKPLSSKSKLIGLIIVTIITLILVIVFLIVTGYIKFGDPVNENQ